MYFEASDAPDTDTVQGLESYCNDTQQFTKYSDTR